jgi:sigma-E factor negative regulatory protein RseA
MLDDEANELELQRVLSQITDDDELRQAWVRYNMARSALSGHQTCQPMLDISQRVREVITDEQSSDGAKSNTPRRLARRFLRPVASLAVAASVAATVVIGGQQLAQIGGADPYGDGPMIAGGVSPVGLVNSLGAIPVRASYGTQAIPVLQPATRTAYQELARQRMQKYMQEHAEHAALNSPHGLIPFARVPQISE